MGMSLCYSALDTLTEIRKQRNSKESKIHGAAVGRRRKSKRSINFETIENDITNYKVSVINYVIRHLHYPDFYCVEVWIAKVKRRNFYLKFE